ncbi:hypothetical protein PHYBOEH_003277 [Phytophthora boehmeriae]|uniref:SP-RING-type domain-containing protein n=1 Tax=Phytophthora boehmeriae TaxID=109152 RepID=A0A8T1WPB0_9STRA|nr:hypothetical protein PHYBOEH_003277 [Phytophthora boehmeriae]
MKTRGQLRQQTALEQDCEQYKTLFLRLAAESRLALLQLGSVLNQRNADLEKQLRDEQNSFERQRAQFLRQASEVKQVQGRIGELVDGLRQQMKDQRSSHEVTRQRADRLQQEIDSRAGQQQTEAALKKENEELLHRLLQKDIEAQQKQKKLQETVEQLQKRLDEQKSLLEEERARFQQHELGERNAMTRLSSSLSTMLPQLRGLLEAYDQEQERARTTSQQAIADTQAVSQDLTQRLSEQQSAFNQERAQLLQQASDALTTHQDISRRNLAQREAILTCPISLDLFNNPVTTDCCGKTFSEAVLTQALARNPVCPVCRDDYVSSYPSRDLAALVELHRSESVVLGVTSAPPSASTSSAPAPVPQPAPIPTWEARVFRIDSERQEDGT